MGMRAVKLAQDSGEVGANFPFEPSGVYHIQGLRCVMRKGTRAEVEG